MIKKILSKIFKIFQVIFILLYLILEELVWERFAQPIFNYIKNLRLFEKLTLILNKTNRYIILVIFLGSFVIGELFGILSPIVMVKGFLILGVLFYIFKLLIVAFALWLFNTQREKLTTFWIINYGYDKIVKFTKWIKSTQIFITVTQKLKIIKKEIKKYSKEFYNKIKVALYNIKKS